MTCLKICLKTCLKRLLPLLAVSLLLFASTPAQQPADVQTTTLSRSPVVRDLKGGEAHNFQASLEAGQVLRAVFTQRGIDIVVRVFAPDGRQLLEVDTPNGAQGPEAVTVTAAAAGAYRFEVRALEATAAAGRYEAKIEELLSAAEYSARLAEERAAADAVKAWLAANRVALRTVEAGNGFADMQPLKKIVGNARLVSLGEATHGTREFFQLKHRMLEFLVSEMGFTVFGIEATMPEGFDINEYVLTGKGDPARGLAGLYFWTWDTEEVLDMIRWMRQYNADPRHTKKVKFYGFDMQSAPRAARVALDYLRRVDPQQATAAGALLEPFANPITNAKFAASSVEQRQATYAAHEALLTRFDEQKAEYVKKSSAGEWAIARQHARVVAQNIEMRKDGNMGNAAFNIRDRSMAENIRWILEHEGKDAKMVVWAHNGHVATQSQSGIEWMGNHLRKWYGEEMVVFGFAFNRGGFQAIEMPMGTGRGLRTFTVGAAPEKSLDAMLAGAGLQLAALDLRALPKEGAVARWFGAPQQTRSIGAAFSDRQAAAFLANQIAPKVFDALLFVENTTAARPNVKGDPRQIAPQLTQPANLSFEEGEVGKLPAGWWAAPAMSRYGFEFTTSAAQAHSGRQSALLARAADNYYGESAGALTQSLTPTDYRGKRVRLRLMARVEAAGKDARAQAYVRLRVTSGNSVKFDNFVNCPVTTADWRAYEVEADVADDADILSYGVYMIGVGRVWFDSVSIEVIPK